MTRVAAVDCGTNSLRLLVADVEPGRSGAGGQLADVVRDMEIVRLGQGTDHTGRLSPEALSRTFQALRRYADIITATGAAAVRMVATSATRDAANVAEFTGGVLAILGIAPEVISGDEEAALSFAGATAELTAAGQPGPYLVLDIGGGSTELVFGPAALGAHNSSATPGWLGGCVTASASVDIGCVRMTERHLRGDPPSAAEIAAATADIDAALDAAQLNLPDAVAAAALVGLAGSVTTVAGIALGLPSYDTSAIHHARIPAAEVHAVTRQLLGSSRAQRAALGVMHPGRVDVIGGGALVLDRVMVRFGFTHVLVSEHDILDGIAWSLAMSAREVTPSPEGHPRAPAGQVPPGAGRGHAWHYPAQVPPAAGQPP